MRNAASVTEADRLFTPFLRIPCFSLPTASDFGLSVKMSAEQSHISNMRRGTPFYTAPEVHYAGNLTKAADLYSYGVVLWEMYHSK